MENITEWIIPLRRGSTNLHILLRWFCHETSFEGGHGGPGYFEADYGDGSSDSSCSWALLENPDEVPFSSAYKPLRSPEKIVEMRDRPNAAGYAEFADECEASFDELRALLDPDGIGGPHGGPVGVPWKSFWEQLEGLLEPKPAPKVYEEEMWKFLSEVATWMEEE